MHTHIEADIKTNMHDGTAKQSSQYIAHNDRFMVHFFQLYAFTTHMKCMHILDLVIASNRSFHLTFKFCMVIFFFKPLSFLTIFNGIDKRHRSFPLFSVCSFLFLFSISYSLIFPHTDLAKGKSIGIGRIANKI